MSVIEDLAHELKIKYDTALKAATGLYMGAWVALDAIKEDEKTYCRMSMAMSRSGEKVDPQLLKQIAECEGVVKYYTDDFKLSFQTFVEETGVEGVVKLKSILDQILTILQCSGYYSCDQVSGRVSELSVYEDYTGICFYDEATLEQLVAAGRTLVQGSKKENMILGTIGAIAGALLGSIVLLFLGRFGIVASLAGFVMGYLTIEGYRALGRILSTKGVVLCIIVMIVVIWFEERFGVAMLVQEATGWSFEDCYRSIKILMAEGVIKRSSYYAKVAMVYLFTAIGSSRVISKAMYRGSKTHMVRKL